MPNDRPTIIIAGSTKCGTTSLYKYLTDHPFFARAYTKETRFFLDCNYPLPQKSFGSRKYHSLFIEQPNTKIFCEATPDYIYSIPTPKRIKEELSDNVIIVFILRDPVKRLLSWFNYSRQIGEVDNHLSINDFLNIQHFGEYEKSLKQSQLAQAQGLYSDYLDSWIEVFSKEKILIFDFQDLVSKPEKVVDRILDRMNVSTDFYTDYKFGKANPTKQARNRSLSKFYFSVNRLARELLKNQQALRPFFKTINDFFSRIVFKTNSRSISLEDQYGGQEIEYLRNFYSDSFEKIKPHFEKLS